MSYPVIPELPPAPLRAQPENDYALTASAFVGAMNPWGQAVNLAGAYIQSTAHQISLDLMSTITARDQASDSAQAAADSKTAAQEYADNLASLDDLWLGAATSDPTTGKGGVPLMAGNAYVNSATGYLRAYNGSAWVQGVSAVAGVSAINGQVGALILKTIHGQEVLGSGDINVLPPVAGQEGKTLVVGPAETPGDTPQVVWGETDGKPGEVRLTTQPLSTPKWLRAGASYLRSAYPKTADRLISGPPGGTVANFSMSGASLLEGAVSPDGKDVVVLQTTYPWVRVLSESDGVLTERTVSSQPFAGTSGQVGLSGITGSVGFFPNGQYFYVSCYGVSGLNGSALAVYGPNGTGWEKVAELTHTSGGIFQCVCPTPDSQSLLISNASVAESFSKYDFNGTALTLTTNPCDVAPPSSRKARGLCFSPDGSKLAVTLQTAVIDLSTSFPGYAIYDVGLDGVYRKRDVATIDPGASATVNFSAVRFSPDSKRVGIFWGFSNSFGTPSPGIGVYEVLGETVELINWVSIPNNNNSPNAQFLEFFDQEGAFVFCGSLSGGFHGYAKQNLASGAYIHLFSTTTGQFWSKAMDRALFIQPSYISLRREVETFAVPSPLTLAISGSVQADFYTFLRAYDD